MDIIRMEIENNPYLNNSILQYFRNIEWCMRNRMFDGIDILLDNIPPQIYPYVYFDMRVCRLVILGHLFGQKIVIDKILDKLVYPSPL